MATTINTESVQDLTLVLTNGADNTEGLVETLRKGVVNYLNLLVQIQVCIEKQRVPNAEFDWGFSDFDSFRYEVEELCKGMERYKNSKLLTV